MSDKPKSIFTCDRCGSEKFVTDDEGKAARHPNDWVFYERHRYLCPACATTYKKVMAWFFEKGPRPDEWRG